MRIAVAVRQRSGRRNSRRQQSPRVPTTFAPFLTLYHFSTTAPTYSLFPAVRTDSRISHKSGSISPPETAAAPKSSPVDSRNDIQLPRQFPSSATTVPQRPQGPSPQQAEIKPPKHFTTAKQADEAAQKAMHQRIHLLPNQGELQQTIGKCSDQRQEFENGLMNPSGPALDHPESTMQWAKTWTRIDPNTGLTPIPSRSGLIYLTPSLYSTLLLVYFEMNFRPITGRNYSGHHPGRNEITPDNGETRNTPLLPKTHLI